MLRTLVENELFALHLAKLGDIERIDDAMVGVNWAIAYMAEDFPVVSGTKTLRLAKTEPLKLKGQRVQLRIWFTIRDESTVELLEIDYVVVS